MKNRILDLINGFYFIFFRRRRTLQNNYEFLRLELLKHKGVFGKKFEEEISILLIDNFEQAYQLYLNANIKPIMMKEDDILNFISYFYSLRKYSCIHNFLVFVYLYENFRFVFDSVYFCEEFEKIYLNYISEFIL